MNRFQLYELVKPHLLKLDFTPERTSLCGTALYSSLGSDCFNCAFYSISNVKGQCHLWLGNNSAQQLKADLTIKHPELFI